MLSNGLLIHWAVDNLIKERDEFRNLSRCQSQVITQLSQQLDFYHALLAPPKSSKKTKTSMPLPSWRSGSTWYGTWLCAGGNHTSLSCAEKAWGRRDHQRALAMSDTIILDERTNNMRTRVCARLLKAVVKRDCGLVEDALVESEYALKIATKCHFRDLAGVAQFQRGVSFYHLGRYPEASLCFSFAVGTRGYGDQVDVWKRLAEEMRKLTPDDDPCSFKNKEKITTYERKRKTQETRIPRVPFRPAAQLVVHMLAVEIAGNAALIAERRTLKAASQPMPLASPPPSSSHLFFKADSDTRFGMATVASLALALCMMAAAYAAFRSVTPPNPPPLAPTVGDRARWVVTQSAFNTRRNAMLLIWLYHILLTVTYPHPSPIICPHPERLHPRLFTWSTYTIVCIFMILAGACVRLTAYRQLGKNFTFQLAKPKTLVKHGLYRYVRHPSYAGFFVVISASFLLLSRRDGAVACWIPWILDVEYLSGIVWTLWIASSIFIGVLRIQDEEAMLKEQFGKEWEEYQAKTKQLIPGVF